MKKKDETIKDVKILIVLLVINRIKIPKTSMQAKKNSDEVFLTPLLFQIRSLNTGFLKDCI